MDYTRDNVEIRRVLRNLGSKDVSEIMQGLEAADGFVANGEVAGAVAPLLRHQDPKVRARAAMSLGHVQHFSGIRHLEAVMTDPAAKVRSTAIDALARLRSAQSAPRIAGHLKDHSPEVRYSVCEALGLLRYTPAAPYIVALLSDPEDIVRLGAAESLGYLELSATAPALINALDDEFHLVRAYAAESLGMIGHQGCKEALRRRLNIETSSRARLGIHTALFRLGDQDDLPKIVGFLNDPNPLARRDAATNLTNLAGDSSAGSLLVALKRAHQMERQKQTRAALEQAIRILSLQSTLKETPRTLAA